MIQSGEGTGGVTSPPVSCISSLSARRGWAPAPKWLHRNDATQPEPPMITTFFAFVTVVFFAAIAAQVLGSVSSLRPIGGTQHS